VLLVIISALLAGALLLPFQGIPSPRVNDEFAYLLAADTFSGLRLANSTPPGWHHLS
jgi:hypothetical protein